VVLGVPAIALAQAATDVKMTTIPPGGDYEVVGIVTSIQHLPPAIFDMSKPFKEVLNRLLPDLSQQARTRGADTVVLTHFTFIPGGSGDHWLQVYGTAIRTKGARAGPAGAAAAAAAAAAEPAAPAATDLSGTWRGKVLETGEDTPVDLTLNLMGGAAPGEYTGGYILSDPACEVSITSTGLDGDVYAFKGEKASKFRCALFGVSTAQLTAEGKLDFTIYGTTGKKVHMQGLLTRQ
jgi:hypothetical protein